MMTEKTTAVVMNYAELTRLIEALANRMGEVDPKDRQLREYLIAKRARLS
jgi:hypothetical protein